MEEWMAYVEGRGFVGDVEPFGLLSEGAAGIATIVLAVIALSGVSSEMLASIVTIIIGAGLMVQAFNSASENSKVTPRGVADGAQMVEVGGEVMVDLLTGLTGVILGILALVGINASHLVPAALIVFGGALLLSGAMQMRPRMLPAGAGQAQIVAASGTAATGGVEVLVGIAAMVLGILALVMTSSWVLILVGFIAIGAAMLMVSATFSGAVTRLFAAA
jgi:hypothetical protein